uniref:Uncharacterized protein n=1 Tax=Opuntia streptacantha TaxID=393608 RepID=A0A7C8ZLC0_OPUST
MTSAYANSSLLFSRATSPLIAASTTMSSCWIQYWLFRSSISTSRSSRLSATKSSITSIAFWGKGGSTSWKYVHAISSFVPPPTFALLVPFVYPQRAPFFTSSCSQLHPHLPLLLDPVTPSTNTFHKLRTDAMVLTTSR